MQKVKPKKHLGQHFLNDENAARRIVDSLAPENRYKKVIEIGAGMGVLSQFLFQNKFFETTLIDIDKESIEFLNKKFPEHTSQIIDGDFLHMDLQKTFAEPFAVIGNFPYNISTQILFRVLEMKEMVPEVVGMFQKEVAVRIGSAPGNRDYGILSVLMQAFYDVEIIFMLDENDFSPPPKVKSAVIRCVRNDSKKLGCDEKKFFKTVKLAFNQRRKTLRNALSSVIDKTKPNTIPYLQLRAEALSWQMFAELTNAIATQQL